MKLPPSSVASESKDTPSVDDSAKDNTSPLLSTKSELVDEQKPKTCPTPSKESAEVPSSNLEKVESDKASGNATGMLYVVYLLHIPKARVFPFYIYDHYIVYCEKQSEY